MPQKDICHIRIIPTINKFQYNNDTVTQRVNIPDAWEVPPFIDSLLLKEYKKLLDHTSVLFNLIPRKKYTWKEKLLWSYYKKPVGVIKRKCKLIWLVLFDDERIEIDREDW